MNPYLVCVGFDLVHNAKIFVCSNFCNWFSLFPIEDRSTDKNSDKNGHYICWKTDLRCSWSTPVKAKLPTTIRWWKCPNIFLICVCYCVLLSFFGVFRFGFYWSIWVYLLGVGWEIYVCYCVLCVCDHVLMFKFEFVFFVFGSGFVLYVLMLMFKYVSVLV